MFANPELKKQKQKDCGESEDWLDSEIQASLSNTMRSSLKKQNKYKK